MVKFKNMNINDLEKYYPLAYRLFKKDSALVIVERKAMESFFYSQNIKIGKGMDGVKKAFETLETKLKRNETL